MNLLPPQILPPLRLDMWHTHEEGVTAFAHADGQTVNEHATRACEHSSLVFLLGEETAAAAPRLTVMLRRSTAWPCRESYWMALHTTKNEKQHNSTKLSASFSRMDIRQPKRVARGAGGARGGGQGGAGEVEHEPPMLFLQLKDTEKSFRFKQSQLRQVPEFRFFELFLFFKFFTVF
jgi:hypothetical protein